LFVYQVVSWRSDIMAGGYEHNRRAFSFEKEDTTVGCVRNIDSFFLDTVYIVATWLRVVTRWF